ncbi:hypothetical protein EGW08_020738 [Elysia chlorotica]|uniref:Probable DNA packing protein N-terminal domain-containing protein n=1 Tax=Elysia chlorotica TaxID=188477 RepID=A0A3S0ZNE1_ELYCH|nr:hypothetical protein EGW08_020738 [Elysia chlorotica]
MKSAKKGKRYSRDAGLRDGADGSGYDDYTVVAPNCKYKCFSRRTNEHLYHGIKTPNGCTFELHLSGRGVWSQVDTLLGPNAMDRDPFLKAAYKLSEGYVLSRLLTDTNDVRAENGKYCESNDYTLYPKNANRWCPDGLFAPVRTNGDNDTRSYHDPSHLTALDSLLKKLHPYVQCVMRFHDQAMSGPHAKHEMFQKSIFYEVLFYYCRYHTDEYTLNKLVTAITDKYIGWESVSTNDMIQRYLGEQYLAIIPRGFGKTVCIRTIVATFMVTFPGVEILALAHRRNLMSAIKDDILSTLYERFPPERYGRYKIESHNECISLTRQDGTASSRLKYGTSHFPNSLRGYDSEIVFQDEFLCLSDASIAALSAMFQRTHCKGGFLSSPVSTRRDKLLNLTKGHSRAGKGVNMYRLCLFCMDPSHLQHSGGQIGCYRCIYTPNHITYSNDNKVFEQIMTDSHVSFISEQGIIHPNEMFDGTGDGYEGTAAGGTGDSGGINADEPSSFYKRFLDRFTNINVYYPLANIEPHGPSDAYYWVYLDPTYHVASQSAAAICCVRKGPDGLTLAFTDRKMLTHADMGNVNSVFKNMYVRCVDSVVRNTHVSTRCNFFVVIERNMSPDSARACYRAWGDRSSYYPNKAFFMFYADVQSQGIMYGYMVTRNKRAICDNVIKHMNDVGYMNFRIAVSVEEGYYTSNVSIIEMLHKELKIFRAGVGRGNTTGKTDSMTTDDCAFSFIMALHFANLYYPSAYQIIHNMKTEHKTPCTKPWVAPNCICSPKVLNNRQKFV